MRSWLTIQLLMLLTACATAPSDRPVKPSCGALFKYSADFESAASNELNALKHTGLYPHIATMMDDYHTTRDTIRACKS